MALPAKVELQRIQEAEKAKQLLDMMADYKANLEKDILGRLAKYTPDDVVGIQSDYKAALNLMTWLNHKIQLGKQAQSNLQKKHQEG